VLVNTSGYNIEYFNQVVHITIIFKSTLFNQRLAEAIFSLFGSQKVLKSKFLLPKKQPIIFFSQKSLWNVEPKTCIFFILANNFPPKSLSQPPWTTRMVGMLTIIIKHNPKWNKQKISATKFHNTIIVSCWSFLSVCWKTTKKDIDPVNFCVQFLGYDVWPFRVQPLVHYQKQFFIGMIHGTSAIQHEIYLKTKLKFLITRVWKTCKLLPMCKYII